MSRDIFMELVCDPAVFEENRLPAHAEYEVMCRDCNAGDSAGEDTSGFVSNRILKLDGEWCFSYAENPAGVKDGFEKDSFDCHNWEKIRVPGHIQLQGYDSPHYTNTAYPWDGKEALARGEVPTRFNPVGEYVRYFEVPEAYVGKGLRISFQGVESAAAIWLNGSYVGYMENSFDPSEFDITAYVRSGENKLAVRVYKWCAGSWCEDQDFFRFSGIFRSVYICYVPENHLEDIRVRALLDDDYKNGSLEVEVRTLRPGAVRFDLTDPEGGEPLRWESGEIPVPSPRLWSAETPNLYRLTVTLSDSSGKPVETTALSVGFRRFEMKDGLMCLNGRRIVFKGVNRHEFSAHNGRVVSDEELLQDIRTMKQNNINAVRTCHYPDDVRIYDLCDEYGLYLIAENNMETHGTWQMKDPVGRMLSQSAADDTALTGMNHDLLNRYAQEIVEQVIPGDDEKWEPMLLDRINSCYQRDKNHPSILIWSIGNESFGGPVLQHMSDRFRELDPERLVHYEGIFHDRRYPDTSDMESQMYPSVKDIEAFLSEHRDKPFICCEYTHAMGNSCGGMHKYTDLAEREPRYQGGFIWDYIDQSLDAKTRYGEPYQAYGGDFGDRPASYEFSGNGIVYGDDRTPSPKMQEVKYNYQGIRIGFTNGRMQVKNLNLFTGTDVYDCVIEWLYEGTKIGESEIETSVAPLSSGEYGLPFYGEEEKSGEYVLIVSFRMKEDILWCDAGHEVAFGQYCYRIGETAERPVGAEASGAPREAGAETASGTVGEDGTERPLEIIRGDENLGVKGKGFELLFSGVKGGLVSYIYKGRQLIGEVPKPNFWRAPTANDRGAGSEQYYAQWKLASLYQRPVYAGEPQALFPWMDEYDKKYGIGIENRSDGTFFIKYRYILATNPMAEVDVSYTVFPDGRIRMAMDHEPAEGLPEMPEFGLMFTLDADLEHTKWYGLGPEETYADRKRGGRIGIWEKDAGDTMARYLVPQECGNHEEVRWLSVTDDDERGLVFVADGGTMSASALPYTPHQLEEALHPYELPEIYHTIVRVSKAQMGVGGDDSWGAKVHPEYLLDVSEPLHFEVTIRGI